MTGGATAGAELHDVSRLLRERRPGKSSHDENMATSVRTALSFMHFSLK